MRATGSTHHHRLRVSARFRVGLAALLASSGLVSAMVFTAQRASAATLTVTNCNARGPGSLFKVVAGAAANSEITFSVTCPSISLTSPINLKVPLVIIGPGASALEVIGPQREAEDAFDVHPNVDVDISGLAFQIEALGFVNQGTLTLDTCTMVNDPNQEQSEAIDNEGSLAIHNCAMNGNDANLNDQFSVGIENNGTTELSDCSMEGYEANDSGGPAVSNDGQLGINQCSFDGNVGHHGAGAIESEGGSVQIARSIFTDNEAINSTGDQIDNDAGTMNVSGTTVTGNTQGGGLSNDGTMTVAASTVSSNVAVKGGGISNAGTLSVTSSDILRNTGLDGGGGIDSAGMVTITGSTISNNFVHGNGKAHGGGISNDAGTMNIADTTVSGNNSNNGTGGGIYNDGTMSLTDSTVSSNTNEGGGGGIGNANTLNVSDSTISQNTLQDTGGAGGAGILNEPVNGSAASLVLTASTLAQNHSAGHGGGVENNGGTAMITASTLAQNVSKKAGGGIENAGGGTATLAATVVAGSSPADCSGVMTDAGYNLDDDASCGFSAADHSDSGVQPVLGPLQDNGGPTNTEEPALGSPLLNDIPTGTTANAVTLCPGTDRARRRTSPGQRMRHRRRRAVADSAGHHQQRRGHRDGRPAVLVHGDDHRHPHAEAFRDRGPAWEARLHQQWRRHRHHLRYGEERWLVRGGHQGQLRWVRRAAGLHGDGHGRVTRERESSPGDASRPHTLRLAHWINSTRQRPPRDERDSLPCRHSDSPARPPRATRQARARHCAGVAARAACGDLHWCRAETPVRVDGDACSLTSS